MIKVGLKICTVVLYADESLLNIKFGHGYRFEKLYLDQLPIKDEITDGNGRIMISYLDSLRNDKQGEYFICLVKDEQLEIEMDDTPIIFEVKNDTRKETLERYQKDEARYIQRQFSILHLYKAGNIGPVQIFYEFKFRSKGIVSNTVKHTTTYANRNIADSRFYSLDSTELIDCNIFLEEMDEQTYEILEGSVNEFVQGLEQINIATGFEKYTTALEMTFLETKLKGKKKCLAKRISVLLKTNTNERKTLYSTMLRYYRYRSESLHDGNESNISLVELHELEDITRQALKKALHICQIMLNANPNLGFLDFKKTLIERLKAEAQKENDVGTFSADCDTNG